MCDEDAPPGTPPGTPPKRPRTDVFRACAAAVYETLGPGYSESVYQNALALELRRHSEVQEVLTEVTFAIWYKESAVGFQRADMIVHLHSGERVVLELKALTTGGTSLGVVSQVRRYLQHYPQPLAYGVILNFTTSTVEHVIVTRNHA